MLTTLDAIVRRLADAYEPDRVILLGIPQQRVSRPLPDRLVAFVRRELAG